MSEQKVEVSKVESKKEATGTVVTPAGDGIVKKVKKGKHKGK
mgnify:CR=1 FL=1